MVQGGTRNILLIWMITWKIISDHFLLNKWPLRGCARRNEEYFTYIKHHSTKHFYWYEWSPERSSLIIVTIKLSLAWTFYWNEWSLEWSSVNIFTIKKITQLNILLIWMITRMIISDHWHNKEDHSTEHFTNMNDDLNYH